ncbi:alginate O-acetyltransferase AlgX-related protein [Alteromonas lipotrueiana]|uniref:alginate O-acetyltransferase AlgX-related protein n=1 Tax=Alteromonas lipotrueiana TaxID=2803815 RepID=UPI001C49594A|nr:hypothetical protein [Alteromonas lipotrueiana]
MKDFKIHLFEHGFHDKKISLQLNEPVAEQELDYNEAVNRGIRIKGYLSCDNLTNIKVGLRINKTFHSLTLIEIDYHNHLFDNESYTPECTFLFNESVVFECNESTLEVMEEDQVHVLYTIRVKHELEILEGKNNWLFLDNDSNCSVDQFRGKLLLSWSRRRLWKRFLKELIFLSKRNNIKILTLIVPSKELIYPEFYPYEKSNKTVLDQLVKLAPNNCNLLIPLNELRDLEESTFRKCDSHWNDYGAQKATSLVALKLLDSDYSYAFENDLYVKKRLGGDLGNKLFPKRKSPELVLKNYDYTENVIFDNKIKNKGRIIVIDTIESASKETLLLFGSSSTYPMLNYLTRIFKTVFFVHSAGHIDLKLLDLIKPKYLLNQTNSRFLIKPATTDFSTELVIKLKKPSHKPFIQNSGTEKNLSDLITKLYCLH